MNNTDLMMPKTPYIITLLALIQFPLITIISKLLPTPVTAVDENFKYKKKFKYSFIQFTIFQTNI